MSEVLGGDLQGLGQALRAGERAKRASLDENEHTRDVSREMATDIMATSTTKLTLFHPIRLARLLRSAQYQQLLVKLDRAVASQVKNAGGGAGAGAGTGANTTMSGMSKGESKENTNTGGGGRSESKSGSNRGSPSKKQREDLAAPSAKGVNRGGGGNNNARDDEDFADDDVSDLLV